MPPVCQRFDADVIGFDWSNRASGGMWVCERERLRARLTALVYAYGHVNVHAYGARTTRRSQASIRPYACTCP
jgi:hypothetical protein